MLNLLFSIPPSFFGQSDTSLSVTIVKLHEDRSRKKQVTKVRDQKPGENKRTKRTQTRTKIKHSTIHKNVKEKKETVSTEGPVFTNQ